MSRYSLLYLMIIMPCAYAPTPPGGSLERVPTEPFVAPAAPLEPGAFPRGGSVGPQPAALPEEPLQLRRVPGFIPPGIPHIAPDDPEV